jgi:hypothetical protein
LIGVRKLGAIAAVQTYVVPIALACLIGIDTDIGRSIDRDGKREVAHGIVLKTPAGHVALGPYHLPTPRLGRPHRHEEPGKYERDDYTPQGHCITRCSFVGKELSTGAVIIATVATSEPAARLRPESKKSSNRVQYFTGRLIFAAAFTC